MIRPDQSSHFYGRDGTPEYDATLREARKHGLLPSVTTVLKIKAKPAVEAWKTNQLLEAVDEVNDLLKIHETEEWKDAVIAAWQVKMASAPELGTAYHDHIEHLITNGESGEYFSNIPNETEIAIIGWLEENHVVPEKVEHCFADGSIMGIGGRIDVAGEWQEPCRPFVLDWKTQGTRSGRVNFYQDWAYQLAANAAGLGNINVDLVSVVVSTTEPGLVEHRVWGDNHIWLQAFQSLHRAWCIEKNYDPFTGGRYFE